MCFKGHHQESKDSPHIWDKIFANYLTNKGLIPVSICQEFLQLSNKKNNPIKYAKNLNRQLSKDDVQMADKHTRYLTLVIREMLIQNYSEILLNTLKMAVIKKAGSNKCWQAYGEIETLTYCLWECKYSIAILENSIAVPQVISYLSGLAYTVLFIWECQSFYLCLSESCLSHKAQLRLQFPKPIFLGSARLCVYF